MSSTPYIEIDWSSSTSQHSYVQLSDPTPPENNSDDILYNTERLTILSAEDVLSLDINDIYPYTYSTLHFNDNETENQYDDEDYFQQLLQANLNAEIEEISVFRNDTPLVDNTPLTPIQDINPIPPLDTALLLENLPIVENINPIPPLDTAPLSENLPIVEEKNTLLVSLKKSHVTTPNQAGYNKIDEIRRSGTVLDKDGYNKKSLNKMRNIFAYSFQTHKLINSYIVRDTRGSGTLYNTKKSRYFLM
ncbi:hypothetical protein RhiirA5_421752, partial [Rhizophagus irregularis]